MSFHFSSPPPHNVTGVIYRIGRLRPFRFPMFFIMLQSIFRSQTGGLSCGLPETSFGHIEKSLNVWQLCVWSEKYVRTETSMMQWLEKKTLEGGETGMVVTVPISCSGSLTAVSWRFACVFKPVGTQLFAITTFQRSDSPLNWIDNEQLRT